MFSYSVFATNGKTTYQAKIVKPDGYPLEAASVTFKFTVLDTVGACVLYSEMYSAVDMRSTGGLISFALGNGARDFPASGTTAVFANVFDNSIVSMPCQAPGIYNPGPNDTRKIVMQFNDGTGWQTLPAMTINSVPYAMYAGLASNAKAINGKAATDFVEVSTLANLNCGVNQAIKFNNATFTCIDVPASGSGGITGVTTSGSVLVTGGTASAPVISIQAATLSQDGYLTSLDYAEFKAKLSASATQIINTLGFAPVSSSTVASQIASSTLAGDVSGNPGSTVVNSVGSRTAAQISTSVDDTLAATASATASRIVKRDTSGNASFSGVSAITANLNYVDIYKPTTSFNVRLQAPTSLSANYVLNLPATSGTTGQVLSTDGAGNLSWINPSTGSVVSVSATAPLASTGGTTPTISISQATSGTDGYLSSSDWNTFNNKQQATSAAIIATLGYEPVASGSVVSSQWVSNGSAISYDQGYVGIGLNNPAHALSVSGTAFFSGVATVSGSLTGAVILPGGNANSNPVIFRFDQNVLAYADKWATVTTTPIFNAQKLFNINDGGVNLYDVNAGADVVIEVTGVSIGNTSNINMWPFVVFHSNPTGNVKLELLNNSLAWETAYEGPTAAYVLKKFSMSAGGLRGARFTFSAMSPNTWLKTVGVIGRNSTPYQWVLRRDGGIVYGDINLLAKLGVGLSSPSARIQIASGSTSIAPLKINSGSLLTSAQAGAIEYDGVNFYLTDDTNTRRSIATVTSPGSFDGTNTISNSSGNIMLSPNNATGSVIVSATTASSDANTGALVVKGGVGVSGNLNVSGSLVATEISTDIIQGNVNLLLNPTAGNVGIGTTNPNSNLEILKTSSATTELRIVNKDPAGRASLALENDITSAYIRFAGTSDTISTDRYANRLFLGTNAGSSGMSFRTDQGNFLFYSQGLGSSGYESLRLERGGSSGDSRLGIGVGYNATESGDYYNYLAPYNITIGAYSTVSERKIGVERNVHPSIFGGHHLGIYAGGAASGSTNTNGGDLILNSGLSTGTGSSNIYFKTVTASVSGAADIAATTKMTVSGNGNVGIGTTAPTEKLQVEGKVKASSFITASASYTQGVNAGDNWIRIASGAGNSYADLRIEGATSSQHAFMRLMASCNFPNGGRGDNCAVNILQKSEHAETNFKGVRIVKMNTYDPYYLEVQLGNNVGADTNIIISSLDNSGLTILNPPVLGSIPVGYDTISVDTSSTLFRVGNGQLNVAGNGNVGIGTATPISQLHVGGINRTLSLAGTPAPQGNASYIIMGNSDSAGVSGPTVMLSANRSTQFGVGDSFSSAIGGNFRSFMTIAPTGNVGIGTSIPDAPLVVSGTGNSGSGQLILRDFSSPTGTSNRGPHMFFDNADGEKGWIGFFDSVTHGDGVQMNIRSYTGPINLTAASTGSHLFVNTSGNVGIGTTNPLEKLHVSGAAYASSFELQSVAGFTGGTRTGIAAPSTLTLGLYTNGSERVRIDASGNVGIGTTNPTYKLDVAGDVRATGSVAAWSDIRTKKNIEVIPASLQKILQIRGVTFDWRNSEFPEKNFKTERDMGVIAQEVEKVFPEAVRTDDEGFKSVAYSILIAPVIEAIKELYAQVSGLKQENEKQKREISALKEKVIEVDQLKNENQILKDYLCKKDAKATFCIQN